jgi:fused signal recognition particle receptor
VIQLERQKLHDDSIKKKISEGTKTYHSEQKLDKSFPNIIITGQNQNNILEETKTHPLRERSWLKRLTSGMLRSSQQLGDSISNIFKKRKLDEETLQNLEDLLIQSDIGFETAMQISNTLRSNRFGKEISSDDVRSLIKQEIQKILDPIAKPLEINLSHKPYIIMVVGVNGSGKTTTIGKIAAKLKARGLSVMLAAGDTFRAAALEQLNVWGARTNSVVISLYPGADAAGVAYKAYEKAKATHTDVLIIDTAGRLHNKTELMDELAKIRRVLAKSDPQSPHTVLQILDATTGQNTLKQIEAFRQTSLVSGLVMTKLDGTARGGILVAVAIQYKVPVHFIGIGEEIDALEAFSAKEFSEAILGNH